MSRSSDNMKTGTNIHFLYASTVHVAGKESIIQTVLGSCVAICIWDSYLKIGGMNHYMLPYWEGNGLSSPKFGDVAIPKLIQKMQDAGSKKGNLIAKVFGGAEVLNFDHNHFNIGQRNIEVARELLKDLNIPIIGYSMGGNRGRKINFIINNGSVQMKYLETNNCNPIQKIS